MYLISIMVNSAECIRYAFTQTHTSTYKDEF